MTPTLRDLTKRAFQGLASMRLAVVLIVVLACVLSYATVLETREGREYIQWFVYGSPWFIALLALLGANILAATLIRFPWRRSQIGFVVTHAGLLVLLFGAVQTFVGGIEGRLALVEGETTDRMIVVDRSQIETRWSRERGKSAAFLFRGGPVDWPEGKHLDLGEVGGVHVTVLRFYRHAQPVSKPAADGKPAVPRLVFEPVDVSGRRNSAADAAALLEVSAGGVTGQVWLGRNHPDFSSCRVQTPEGPVALSFGYESLPLGFSLKLLDAEQGLYPGDRRRAASYSSTVQLVDPARGINEQHVISMNEPLVYNGYRFYQMNYEDLPGGKAMSTLTVAHDPGRAMKYAGSLMICVGCLIMFVRRRVRPAASMLGLIGNRRSSGGNGDAQRNHQRRPSPAGSRVTERPAAASRAKAG